jgi:hypothetical protein
MSEHLESIPDPAPVTIAVLPFTKKGARVEAMLVNFVYMSSCRGKQVLVV